MSGFFTLCVPGEKISVTFGCAPDCVLAQFQATVDWSKEANEHFKRIGHALDKDAPKFTNPGWDMGA
eukprot:CAMPEP_0196735886 /NCGR_PEP_ID=MMETSP1091-20130531/14139_1 /TAXON_ID=302021 /ORGANISM="Rhodomonas sp., Strain CCMP768" /LENGTH=66 /DNA_ID=CAMNT_0042079567 /DNA_START=68 /DNA_END=268 /DNA_ORIENTATION=-